MRPPPQMLEKILKDGLALQPTSFGIYPVRASDGATANGLYFLGSYPSTDGRHEAISLMVLSDGAVDELVEFLVAYRVERGTGQFDDNL